MAGSSPQARGARWDRGLRVLGLRLIPAGAGSTPSRSTVHGPTGAHPRRRGEHLVVWRPSWNCAGSSPQARGALVHPPRHERGHGLIPAGAGSTSSTTCTPAVATAHPRRRGEHNETKLIVGREEGSSPQARGAPPRWIGSRRVRRLIPAGAGSTPTPILKAPRPRGSSPQARGAPPCTQTSPAPTGLIPAGAGSTWGRHWTPWTPTAHPRRRGEHTW